MSKVITLRVSDEVLVKLDGATENRSKFVSELIEKWSGGDPAKVERATAAMAEAKQNTAIVRERQKKEESARPIMKSEEKPTQGAVLPDHCAHRFHSVCDDCKKSGTW